MKTWEIMLPKEELERVKEIIIRSIKTRVEKANAKGGIVALSGGIDSSLVTILAQMALGSERLLALIMPEKDITPEKDLKDALSLVEKHSIPHRLIWINDFVEMFGRILEEESNNSQKEWALINVKPRIRMIINYMYANLYNYIVIGTSNKTELLLGYGTKYGDMACDIYPIGDLYKTQVWQLAEHLGLPTDLIKKVPTAGLWKGQTDEEELGYAYNTIDSILFLLVDKEMSVREVSKYLSMDEEAIYDIYERVVKNEHKRRTPTITRLSDMCLDKDWRYPVERY